MRLYRVDSRYTFGDIDYEEKKWFSSKKDAKKYKAERKKEIKSLSDPDMGTSCYIYPSDYKIELTKKGVLEFLNKKIELK